MTNAFEYGDALLPQNDLKGANNTDSRPTSPTPIASNQPYLNLATLVPEFIKLKISIILSYDRFRMVVLADEVLESFFETDLSESFKLHPLPEMELPSSQSGILGDLWSTIATDNNKKMFNMFTDEIGKTIGKHQVLGTPLILSIEINISFF